MTRKKVLFIINPISGGKSKQSFKKVANQCLDKTLFSPDFVFTKGVGHAEELAKKGIENGFEIIVAVGGDGTINEVAKALLGSNIILGIIPKGSGNGLARTLHIPINDKAALSLLNQSHVKQMDVGYINGIPFFNMAGIGFDALISSRFAHKKSRGPLGYMETVFSEIVNYIPMDYQITADGIVLERKAFMISIANSPQYGNEAYISPDASIEDGLLDVCIVKPFHWTYFPKLIYYLFSKQANKTEYVEIVLAKKIEISRSSADDIHVDGEPTAAEKNLEIVVHPKCLWVICSS